MPTYSVNLKLTISDDTGNHSCDETVQVVAENIQQAISRAFDILTEETTALPTNKTYTMQTNDIIVIEI